MMKGNKFGAETARQGDRVVGILDDDDLLEIAQLVEEANKFKPQELNEANVQAIFERCLITEQTTDTIGTSIMDVELGDEEEIVIALDKDALRKNEKSIRYLYGQLKSIHISPNETIRQSLDDFRKTYMNTIWAQGRSAVLELLYLGSNSVLGFVAPFSKA